jgi:hypothetical protein
MMQLQGWLAEFCKMHERAHRGSLSGGDQAEYLAARDELARAVLRAQRIVLKPGELPRRSLRAALALQVVLQLPTGRLQTLTQDVSSGGFSALVSTQQPAGHLVPFALRLSREGAPVEGNVKVMGTDPGGTGLRVAFAYDRLPPEAVERIELAVFDSLVAQLTAQS